MPPAASVLLPHVAGQRDEAHGDQPLFTMAGGGLRDHANLLIGVADGDYQPPADGKLRDQRRRHVVRRRRDDDAVKGRLVGPAAVSVAVATWTLA